MTQIKVQGEMLEATPSFTCGSLSKQQWQQQQLLNRSSQYLLIFCRCLALNESQLVLRFVVAYRAS